uniref:glycosyltransferase family 2 protein n=2 Tax=Aminobacter sp. Piv2-1 TaxID=3031122 RepID=UPI0030ED0A1A
MSSRSMPRLRLCVAAITRERPLMLAQLMASWAACETPPGVDVAFVVVENAARPDCRDLVAGAAGGLKIDYRLEPRIGIPIARNRAVELAVACGADLIAFVDDDERVAADWLVELVAEYRRSRALLIGGPVEAQAPAAPLSRWRKAILRGVQQRFGHKAEVARRQNLAGRVDRVTVVTNNWLAHRDLFVVHGLRFDERDPLTGGSDAAFDREVTRRGLLKSWADKAVVYETMPPERLTFAYQFRRARDQSLASFARKQGRGWRTASGIAAILPYRLVAIGVVTLAIPLRGGPGIVASARAAGWSVGRILGLFGTRSRLYAEVTGK